MQRRRLLALTTGFVIVVGLTVLFIVRPWVRPAPQVLPTSQSLTYTDNITGTSTSDLPQESGGTGAGQAALPGVDIKGTDALDAYITSDQLQGVVEAMKHFLAARSGLSAVDAGIQDRQILQSNHTLSFTLVADRPQAKYAVTIDTSNSSSPNITIGEAQ